MTFLENLEYIYQKDCPIFIEDLVDKFGSYDSVKQKINVGIKNNRIKRYSRGVYYFPSKTILGDGCPDFDRILERKYIYDDNSVYGYYSGLKLLNMCGMSKQVPYVYEIVTNKETNIKRNVNIDGHKIILRRPNIEINKNNYKYLQFLDIIKYSSIEDLIENKSLLVDIYSIYMLDKEKLKEYVNKSTISIRNKMRVLNIYDELA